jgi:hypothetical protein
VEVDRALQVNHRGQFRLGKVRIGHGYGAMCRTAMMLHEHELPSLLPAWARLQFFMVMAPYVARA